MNMPPHSQQPPPPGLVLSPSGNNHSTPPILPSLDPGSPSVMLGENGLVIEQTTDGDWSYDPNEPRYCICNQVSYGDMVACDNEAVIKIYSISQMFENIFIAMFQFKLLSILVSL